VSAELLANEWVQKLEVEMVHESVQPWGEGLVGELVEELAAELVEV
jgi:hypothetical protein